MSNYSVKKARKKISLSLLLLLLTSSSMAQTEINSQQPINNFFMPKNEGQQSEPLSDDQATIDDISSASVSMAQSETTADNAKVPVLTLTDAVALALRNNADLESAKLNRITDKFSLLVEKYNFQPQYSLGMGYDYEDTSDGSSSNALSFTPQVTLNNHHGTSFTLSEDNNYDPGNEPLNGSFTPSLTFTVSQELMKGFGKAVVDASLNNAKDDEIVNRLGFQSTISSTITTIIGDYFTLVGDYQQLGVDKQQWTLYQEQIRDTKMQIKAGQVSKSDLINVESSQASTELSIEQDYNAITQNRQALLNDMGLRADTPFKLPTDLDKELDQDAYILSNKNHLPTIKQSVQYALAHNVSYQTAIVTIRQTARSLLVAKNDALPTLTLKASRTQGGEEVSNGSTESLVPGADSFSDSVSLNYDYTIADPTLQQSVASAKVALQNAQISLQQARRDLDTTLKSNIFAIASSKSQVKIAEQTVKLQEQNLNIANKKYAAGLISTYERNQVQQQLQSDRSSLITTRISYLISLDNFFGTDLNMNLDLWNIKVKY